MATQNIVCESLREQGMLVAPLVQGGVEVKLTWVPKAADPILEDRVIVVLPDIHLSNDGDGDIFRQNKATRHARLRLFLQALIHARELVEHHGRRFSVVHLGDFYDVWRAYPEYKDHPTSDYRAVETKYADVIDLMINGLDMRVCVGNHDANLARFPPWWARNQLGPNGRLAYAQRFAGGKVVAFHGHQLDQADEAMQAQDGSTLVKIATIAAKLSNPLSLLIQQGIDLQIDLRADHALALDGLSTGGWEKSRTLRDQGGFSCSRWCDRLNMQHAKAVLERTVFSNALRIAFIGHSHRAGITATHVGERFVPVIDAGSWAWGQSQFAIAVEGEVSLWNLGAE
jgi:hypothetical protein